MYRLLKLGTACISGDLRTQDLPAYGAEPLKSLRCTIDEEGNWVDQTAQKNTSADMSPTAGQMARLLGLAQASKVYRENDLLSDWNQFSDNGNEVAWGTIGDASTSEGIFWETINAAGVLQVP
ncbi:thiamine pyrophosphate-dependent enzyme, partial [Longimonas sp.]|uniref:thiamine pyrophosphate-dependent enzyme n=1 Tax=Longimonas sp. TaxID=2039626 RepID=UPI00397563CA